MAISYDNTTSDVDDTPSSPLTFNHTTAVQDNRLLVLNISYDCNDTSVNTATAVTYGGETLTKIHDESAIGATWSTGTEMWYKLNPKTGTNQVSVTFGTDNDFTIIIASTFYNVNQSAPDSTDEDSHTSTDNITCTVTPGAASNICIAAAAHGAQNQSLSAAGGETEVGESKSVDSDGLVAANYYELDCSTGGETLSVDATAAFRMCIVGATWQEYEAPTPPPPPGGGSIGGGGAFPDMTISGSSCSFNCACSRWDVQNYNIILETWLKENEVKELLESTTVGAVGELYKILGKPHYYDKTWTGNNTIKITPMDEDETSSTLHEMRNPQVIFPKNITTHPIVGSKDWIEVKIEGMISGSGNL